MIALKQADGTIITYGHLPNVIVNDKNQTVLGVHALSEEERKAHGLYPITYPDKGQWDDWGDLYYDKERDIITYTVLADVRKPTLANAAAQKRAELEEIEKQMRARLAENTIDAIIDGDTTAAQALLATLRSAKEAALAKIQGHVDAEELDELLNYNLNSPQTEALLAAIENLKNDDSGN